MVVFSNHRLGPAGEVLVSPAVAEAMLREVAAAAREVAAARWEHELVRWLEDRAARLSAGLDVAEIAWSPENFERQQRFVLDAIERAAASSEHARAHARWAQLVARHPPESVQFGRRWTWQPTA